MKNTKRIAMLTSLVMLLSTLLLTACNKEGDPSKGEHTHTWGNWVTVKPVTKTEDGLLERTCSSCGEKESFVLKSSDVYQGTGYYTVGNVPDCWNPITCTGEDAKHLLKYLSTPLFVYEYRDYVEKKEYTEEGLIDERQLVFSEECPYEFSDYYVDYFAAAHLEDVTAQFVGDPKWGYTEGQIGYAWKITLRDDMKWADGHPIRAEDFIYSMMQVLDPRSQSPLAEFYYDTLGIKNARAYHMQDPEQFHHGLIGSKPAPAVTREDVGIFVAESDLEFVICLDKSHQFLKEYGTLAPAAVEYLAYFPLVYMRFYEATTGESPNDSPLFTSIYNTYLESGISWGPYKLVDYKAGSYYKLEVNANWYGWGADGTYANRYSFTSIHRMSTTTSGKE
ncbi:MAG: hypothetical protein E7659_02685 [Ruminococcaceae bacterium]|nr:hypothetical protein [Oscillospiraceae bacterium]